MARSSTPPNAGFVGNDSFEYLLTDTTGGTAVGAVSVAVGGAGANHAPVAVADTYPAYAYAQLSVAPAEGVLVNDTDVDRNTTLRVLSFTQGQHGSVGVGVEGNFFYQPDAGYVGADSFVYFIQDGNGGLSSAKVNLDVQDGGGTSTPLVIDISNSTLNNTINGGSGDDIVKGDHSSGNNTISLNAGNDDVNLTNTSGQNVVHGGDGDDTLYITDASGSYQVTGDAGNDDLAVYLQLSPGALSTATIDGGAGADRFASFFTNAAAGVTVTLDGTGTGGVIATAGAQIQFSQIEGLSIEGTAYADVLLGGSGDDVLVGEGGADLIDGGDGGDGINATIIGSETATIRAGAGNDSISGFAAVTGASAGTLAIDAGTGNDSIALYDGVNANIQAGDGDDTIYLPLNSAQLARSIVIDGGNGSDTLSIDMSQDLSGAPLILSLDNAAGNPIQFQNIESTVLWGTPANDKVSGFQGLDRFYSFGGNDTFIGKGGSDIIVVTLVNGGGFVTATDFGVDDHLFFYNTETLLSPLDNHGALTAAQFTIGAAATTADQRVIYNDQTGALYYDADGSGSGAPELMAMISAHLALTAGNFGTI